MTEEQIKQKADDYIIKRQNHIKYFSGEAVKILLKNFAEEIVTDAIKDLQKENAELKEKLEIEQNARGDWFGKAVTKDRRLNEAKEIIRELISMKSIYATCKEVEHRFTTIAKAEAFLKE